MEPVHKKIGKGVLKIFNKILVAVDGSECSMRAVEVAAELAEINPKARVVVFTVDRVPLRFLERDLQWMASNAGEKVRHIEEVFAEIREKILKEATSVFRKKGLAVYYDHSFGNPAEEIVAYARKNGADLIVMGTRGLSVMQEIFLGSVSHKVLQLSPCPVLLVK